jgi:hypothetical protein
MRKEELFNLTQLVVLFFPDPQPYIIRAITITRTAKLLLPAQDSSLTFFEEAVRRH